MIAAVVFDWDGTLMDDDASWKRCVAATAEAVARRHPRVDPAELAGAYFAAAERIWDELRDTLAPPWGNMDDRRIVERAWSVALRPDASGDAAALAAATWTALRRTDVPIYDDVIECLDALRGRFRMGVLTNGSAATHLPKVEASGLRRYFGSVTTTDVGAGKPLRAIFDHALAALDAAPSRSVYVGDSLLRDVGGANGAGMTSVWINRTGAQLAADDPVPDAEIVSLRELPGVLDRLQA
ncbi:MAG: HAD family hydrolase [Spirochaetaceae bacterium]|nr:HAD family hydrolase [Spirochaetaceae bacterium]